MQAKLLLCALVVLVDIVPSGSFVATLHPALLNSRPAVFDGYHGQTGTRSQARLALARVLHYHRLRARAENSPAERALDTWTPKSGKKPLVVLVGFMGATPTIMVHIHRHRRFAVPSAAC